MNVLKSSALLRPIRVSGLLLVKLVLLLGGRKSG
jgi:hypothetical protein